MCNPYASNMWVKEWASVEHALTPDMYNKLSKMDWPEEEKTWENLFAIAHTVDEIYLTGGEPTVIKKQQKLLKYITPSKWFPFIVWIFVSSNCQNTTEK